MWPFLSLKRRSDFVRIQQHGTRFRGQWLIVCIERPWLATATSLPSGCCGLLCGLTVTKKIGAAVLRNTIKRRLRIILAAIARERQNTQLAIAVVVIAFANIIQANFLELKAELRQLLQRGGVVACSPKLAGA